jgi:2-oxoisovalerate dehydrogenase E1 component
MNLKEEDNFSKTTYSLLYIRKFEEALLKLFQEGELNGTTHTCIGQEEIPVAIMPLLKDQDYVFSNHRGHGHYLAFFQDAEGLMAEIMGREGGICNGVGGSQHIKRGNYFSTGIQGESVPVATGVALQLKREENHGVAVSFIGDGTWGQGAVYEAVNMASLWQVPLIIICENNSISQSTPSSLNMAGNIENRAKAFGVDYYQCAESLDVQGIQDIVKPAIENARELNRPAIIEIKTRRLSSHSKGDDTRSADEILALVERDWILKLRSTSSSEFLRIENKINSEIESLVTKVKAAPLVMPVQETYRKKNLSISSSDEELNGRVLDNLNKSFHKLMDDNDNVFLVGEDLLDPYGGAFKASKGLSTKHPQRVISTPISEVGLAGVGNGLSLAGQKVIVEFMFSDFVFLASDQIINFAAKTVSMYGQRIDHPILFRCPVGGHRGYGATHSQSVQKFFIGVPNLDLYELSPLHDCVQLLPSVFETGNPSMLFESKVLYAKDRIPHGKVLDLFIHKQLDDYSSQVFIEDEVDVVLITGGSLVYDCLQVAKKLFLEHELSVHIINPFKIYPLEISSFAHLIEESKFVCIVEEGTEGGTWGSEVSNVLRRDLTEPELKIISLSSKNSIIPSSRHLESEVLIKASDITNQILKEYSVWKK